jgi:hypothetical protein
MVSTHIVDRQLKAIGCNFQGWGRTEARELSKILTPYEVITECLNGHYENGFAMLCSTNQRVILVDRKPMYLTLEDVRYDMIAEIDFGYRIMNSYISIFTPTKTLTFTSWNQHRLRRLVTLAQQRVMEIRHYQQNGMPQPTSQTQQPLQQAKTVPLPQLTPVNNLTPNYQQPANQYSPPISTDLSSTAYSVPSSIDYSAPSVSTVPFPSKVSTFARMSLITKNRLGRR